MKKTWIFLFVVTTIFYAFAVYAGCISNTNTSFGCRTDGVHGSARIHLPAIQGV